MFRQNESELDMRRVIALIDIDCFSVQVDLKDFPEYVGHPCATKHEGKDAIIVSVNYEAKARGVSRQMRSKGAQNRCPEIKFFNIPQKYDKPYVQKYTEASDQIFDCVEAFVEKFGNLIIIEKQSQDEVYLDITQFCQQCIEADDTYSSELLRDYKVIVEGGKRSFLLSNRNGMRRSPLTHGAVLITDICDQILCKTGYKSSAGISYNKLLAKIACSFNKPERVTIIATKPGIERVFQNCKVEDLHGLGSDFGEIVKRTLRISTAYELRRFSINYLIEEFDIEDGKKLWDISRGIDERPVTFKAYSNAINSGRKFNRGINNSDQKEYYTMQMCKSLCEKLIYDKNRNKRIAQYIRAQYLLNRNVGKGFDIDPQFYYDWKYIYNKIKRIVFPKLNQYNSRRIFNIKLTAYKFIPEEETQMSYIESTADRLGRIKVNHVSARNAISCYSVRFARIVGIEDQNSYDNFDNFYTNDENDDYENWCQEFYDSYQY